MDGFYAKYISVSNIIKIPSLIIAFDRRRAYPANLPKVVVSLGWGNEWKVLFVFFVKFPERITERMEFWFILFRRCALKGEISESIVSMDGYCTKYISVSNILKFLLIIEWLSSCLFCSLTQGRGVVGFDGVAEGELNKELMVGDST